METIRTFTAFDVLDSNLNITLELIKCNDHYEVRETYKSDSKKDQYTITRKFAFYSMAKYDYENSLYVIQEYA